MLSAKMLAQKPGDNEMPVPLSGQPVPGAAFAVPNLTSISATANQRAPRVSLGALTEKNIGNSPLGTIQSPSDNPPPSVSSQWDGVDVKRQIRRLTLLGRIEDVRELALADPSGLPDHGDARRYRVAVFQCFDHRAISLDAHPIQATSALDDQEFVASKWSNRVGQRQGTRRLELRDFTGLAIDNIDSKKLPGRVGIHIHVSIASECDAVQARATGGGCEQWIVGPDLELALSRRQPQDLGRSRVGHERGPVRAYRNIVTKGVIAR